MSIIAFGKYSGNSFEHVLLTDLPYCQFIHRCRENDKIKAFKDWLQVHLERGIEHNKAKRLAIFLKNQNHEKVINL